MDRLIGFRVYYYSKTYEIINSTGTDDDAVVHVVSTRCNLQRQELKEIFKTLYGRVN